MIYNQNAGQGGISHELFQSIEYLSVHGYEVTIFPVVPEEGLTSEYIIQDTKGRFDVYLFCGGDGTLNHAINGLIGNDIDLPFSYVPVGSTNDFSKSLYGNGNHSMLEVCKYITGGKQFTYDIGKFNESYFNYVAGFGVFPQVSYTTPQDKKNRLGYIAYVLNFMGNIPGGLTYSRHCRITHDGTVEEGDFMFGLITNSISVAGMQPGLIKRSSLTDGAFEATLVKSNITALDIPGILAALNSDNPKCDALVTFQMKNAVFEFDDDVPWTLDGEDGGIVRRAEVKVIPDKVKVFVPSEE